MSRHDRQGDKDKYTGNGHDPDRPVPREDPGGKHANDKGTDDQDGRDTGK